jgi:predicted transcriptional regulator
VKVREIQERFGLSVACGGNGLDREVAGGYCGDLLSDVMAHAPKGGIWMTIQSHQNILAVAVLRELSAIVLVNGRTPDQETAKRADEEGIPILVHQGGSFDLAGRLYENGIGRVKG